jgi:carbon storage regulator CsrA
MERIITLKLGEKLTIGEVTVHLVEIYSNRIKPKIKLGLEAPKAVRIYRSEIYERLKQEKQELEDKIREGDL